VSLAAAKMVGVIVQPASYLQGDATRPASGGQEFHHLSVDEFGLAVDASEVVQSGAPLCDHA
jgi:hypothetical protein